MANGRGNIFNRNDPRNFGITRVPVGPSTPPTTITPVQEIIEQLNSQPDAVPQDERGQLTQLLDYFREGTPIPLSEGRQLVRPDTTKRFGWADALFGERSVFDDSPLDYLGQGTEALIPTTREEAALEAAFALPVVGQGLRLLGKGAKLAARPAGRLLKKGSSLAGDAAWNAVQKYLPESYENLSPSDALGAVRSNLAARAGELGEALTPLTGAGQALRERYWPTLVPEGRSGLRYIQYGTGRAKHEIKETAADLAEGTSEHIRNEFKTKLGVNIRDTMSPGVLANRIRKLAETSNPAAEGTLSKSAQNYLTEIRQDMMQPVQDISAGAQRADDWIKRRIPELDTEQMVELGTDAIPGVKPAVSHRGPLLFKDEIASGRTIHPVDIVQTPAGRDIRSAPSAGAVAGQVFLDPSTGKPLKGELESAFRYDDLQRVGDDSLKHGTSIPRTAEFYGDAYSPTPLTKEQLEGWLGNSWRNPATGELGPHPQLTDPASVSPGELLFFRPDRRPATRIILSGENNRSFAQTLNRLAHEREHVRQLALDPAQPRSISGQSWRGIDQSVGDAGYPEQASALDILTPAINRAREASGHYAFDPYIYREAAKEMGFDREKGFWKALFNSPKWLRESPDIPKFGGGPSVRSILQGYSDEATGTLRPNPSVWSSGVPDDEVVSLAMKDELPDQTLQLNQAAGNAFPQPVIDPYKKGMEYEFDAFARGGEAVRQWRRENPLAAAIDWGRHLNTLEPIEKQIVAESIRRSVTTPGSPVRKGLIGAGATAGLTGTGLYGSNLLDKFLAGDAAQEPAR